MIEQDPTERFSIRAQDYVKYRPTYPTAVLDCLIREYGLTENGRVRLIYQTELYVTAVIK